MKKFEMTAIILFLEEDADLSLEPENIAFYCDVMCYYYETLYKMHHAILNKVLSLRGNFQGFVLSRFRNIALEK